MVFPLSTKWNILNRKMIPGEIFSLKIAFFLLFVKMVEIFIYFRKSAAGMSHHRSAHAMAKLSDIPKIEDFVYEPRTSLVDREIA